MLSEKGLSAFFLFCGEKTVLTIFSLIVVACMKIKNTIFTD